MRAPSFIVMVVLALMMTAVPAAPTSSAKPDNSTIYTTTCTYDQVLAALTAVSPQTAAKLNSSPPAQVMLRNFLGASLQQRHAMVDDLRQNPKAQKYLVVVSQVVKVCKQF